MQIQEVTVGMPVRELHAACAWYERAFDLSDPDQIPGPGMAEYKLGNFWLQLVESPDTAGVEGASVNITVDDATVARDELRNLGLEVSELQRFDDVVDYFELTDLDGNKIGFVTQLG